MSLLQIYELAISMVTALLGLAYPLFVDKISDIGDKYKSKRLSKRFRGEFVYSLFNVLLVISIVELFTIPFVLSGLKSSSWSIILLTVQGLFVFVLSMCMVVLYDLLLTYRDADKLFQRIRAGADNEQKLTDIVEMMKFAATDEERADLYSQCVSEFNRFVLEFQAQEMTRNA